MVVEFAYVGEYPKKVFGQFCEATQKDVELSMKLDSEAKIFAA